MKKIYLLSFLIVAVTVATTSFSKRKDIALYESTYFDKLSSFRQTLVQLQMAAANIQTPEALDKVRQHINEARVQLKKMDFWFRYLDPTVYKLINGPLPVEWETEVFEKFEAPYKRKGAGLTLAWLYTEEDKVEKDSLANLLQIAVNACEAFVADSNTRQIKTYHHFFLCNRLHLLNLAAIYTTGFECPDTERIIPELRLMMEDAADKYHNFNESFPATPITENYLGLYRQAIEFVTKQPNDYERFDHFTFIKDFINPLYRLNQQSIADYRVVSRSFTDYSLSKKSRSIFDKNMYYGQNAKGIFSRVEDEAILAEIDRVGKLLFYDPILSGNNRRSCASCHKPTEYFTDTALATPLHFNQRDVLLRNTPSIINVAYNHLVMLDGKHITLQDQTNGVLTNAEEMGSIEKQLVHKVLSCRDYKKAFTKLLPYTPQEETITAEHIVSAITLYYNKFSNYYASFDEAMNGSGDTDPEVKEGFNIFMSKAQCATCHFVPQFNGVKPPYVGSEFEVLGVPADTNYSRLSDDKGRYEVNPAKETLHAFRTGSLRNINYTAPYMHNGVFKTLDQVIDFYDTGGGTGRGLQVDNQTLSADSLHLTPREKRLLIKFMGALNEKVVFEAPPGALPPSKNKNLNSRKIGGEY